MPFARLGNSVSYGAVPDLATLIGPFSDVSANEIEYTYKRGAYRNRNYILMIFASADDAL